MACEGDRSAEAKRPQAQKVEQQLTQGIRRRGGTAQHRWLSRRFWFHGGELLLTTLAKFVEHGLEAGGQLIGRSFAPIVKKNDGWRCVDHVVVDGYNV